MYKNNQGWFKDGSSRTPSLVLWRRVCARGMEGSGEISSFELQFMHIIIFIADLLLEAPVFAVYSL